MTQSAAPNASLSLTSRTERGGYVIAALSGDLGIASAPALREQLLGLLRRAASHLIIDLSAVERADASGLAVLVRTGRRAGLLGGSLRLAAPSPEVARVLSATGINQHLDIFPTIRAAITGQPGLPEAIFPPATVPARGHRIDAATAGVATLCSRHARVDWPQPWTQIHIQFEVEVAAVLGINRAEVQQAAMIAVAYPHREDFKPAYRELVQKFTHWDSW